MFNIIKNKGKIVKAYQLGSEHVFIKGLLNCGKILDLGNGKYEVYSQEVINANERGEVAQTGDWIKVDGSKCPYPNDKNFFEANHRHIMDDTFEQIPKMLYAWDKNCVMCPEIEFLVKEKGLIIDKTSFEHRYSAPLWGTKEVAKADAVIIFYDIEYDAEGVVKDADFNFISRDEFEQIYNVLPNC